MKTASILIFLVFFFGYLFGTAGTLIYADVKLPNDQPAGMFSGLSPGGDLELMGNITVNETNITTAVIKVPAVNQDKQGVATLLYVSTVPGYGRTLVNIDKLLFWVDTQNSIRTSRDVASHVTGKDLSSTDTVYSITADASVIEGGSAGAALTIVTIAALENKNLKPDVMITGTINPDGTIGPIGEVLAKARVSKQLGATTFLVPRTQSSQVSYVDKTTCDKIGLSEICRTETVPHSINVGDEAGINVIEVYTIDDAVRYFFEE